MTTVEVAQAVPSEAPVAGIIETAEPIAVQSGDQRIHLAEEDLPVDTEPNVNIPTTGIPIEEIERQAVVKTLRMCNWVQKDAAELLAISPRVMNYKIKILGIVIPRKHRDGFLAQRPAPAAD